MTNDYHFFLSFRWASTTRASSPHRLFPRFPRPITTSFRFRLREWRERLDFLDWRRLRRLRPRRRFFLVPLKWLARKNLPLLSLLVFAIYVSFCDAFQLRAKQSHNSLETYMKCFIQQQMYYIGKNKLRTTVPFTTFWALLSQFWSSWVICPLLTQCHQLSWHNDHTKS